MRLMKRIEIQQINHDHWIIQWYTNGSRINSKTFYNHYDMQVFANKLLDEDTLW